MFFWRSIIDAPNEAYGFVKVLPLYNFCVCCWPNDGLWVPRLVPDAGVVPVFVPVAVRIFAIERELKQILISFCEVKDASSVIVWFVKAFSLYYFCVGGYWDSIEGRWSSVLRPRGM